MQEHNQCQTCATLNERHLKHCQSCKAYLPESSTHSMTLPSYKAATSKSAMFSIITVCTGIFGFISGIVTGKMFSTGTFNTALMFSVWVFFTILTLFFFAAHCFLQNQEQHLKQSQLLSSQLKTISDQLTPKK